MPLIIIECSLATRCQMLIMAPSALNNGIISTYIHLPYTYSLLLCQITSILLVCIMVELTCMLELLCFIRKFLTES